MNPDVRPDDPLTADATPSRPLEDTCVFRAVEEYLAEIEAGRRPDRAAFLERHADIADRLSGCLAALEAVHGANPSRPASAEEDLPALKAGAVVGGFRVVRELGHGGMGVVYLALDERLNRAVALKVIRPAAAADPVARKRFVREAQANAALHHEHIITVYQVGEDGGLPFLAMEFLHGQTLEERLRQGPLPLSEAVHIACETAQGLAAAHEGGLVHRDIKPANLFLETVVRGPGTTVRGPAEESPTPVNLTTPSVHDARSTTHESRVKILDFGLARMAERESDGRLTETGVTVGTPHYMSPEQAAGDAVDHRADLFSLGCVLYRLLTGTVPFTGDNLRAVFRSVLLDVPPSPRERRPTVPPALADLTLRLLAKDPAQRPQSAREVSETLRRIEADLARPAPAKTQAADTDVIPAHRPSRRRPLVYSVLAILGLLGLGLGYVAYQSWTDPDNGEAQVPTAPPQPDSPSAPPIDPKRPFVIPAKDGLAWRNFASLAEAVTAAASGDTIEIHSDGPFYSGPIVLDKKDLVLRAGKGFRPVLKQDLESIQAKKDFLTSNSRLVLEGLTVRRYGPETAGSGNCLVMQGGVLYLTHCRFEATGYPSRILAGHCPSCEVRNCMFVTTVGAKTGGPTSQGKGKAVFHNNLIAGNAARLEVSFDHSVDHDFSLDFSRNTVAGGGLALVMTDEPGKTAPLKMKPQFHFDVRENVFHFEGLGNEDHFFSLQQPQPKIPGANEGAVWEKYLRQLVDWHEQKNVYSQNLRLLALVRKEGGGTTFGFISFDTKKLAAWEKFWGIGSTGSIQGEIVLAIGPLIGLVRTIPHKVLPADLRLEPGSAGKGAGPDGKDLGADINLVGPGPAYEAWQKTPEYQKWLKDTGQLKQPFVVLKENGKEGPNFPTLAEAVAGAASGDTIEIRGNGPFVCEPISIHQGLVIRAGTGFTPVLKQKPETLEQNLLTAHDRLILEGLTIHRFSDQPTEKFQAYGLVGNNGPFYLTNCRFIGQTAGYSQLFSLNGSRCEVRNCLLLGNNYVAVGGSFSLGMKQAIYHNNLIAGQGAYLVIGLHDDHANDFSFVCSRNTQVGSGLRLCLISEVKRKIEPGKPQLHLEVRDSIIDFHKGGCPCLFTFQQFQGAAKPGAHLLPPAEAETYLRQMVSWKEQRNVYSAGGNCSPWRTTGHR